jgi:uncharacterized protein YjbI with pentapeptide repeats
MKKIDPEEQHNTVNHNENSLGDQWIAHKEELEKLITIIKNDPHWHKSDVHKALMDKIRIPLSLLLKGDIDWHTPDEYFKKLWRIRFSDHVPKDIVIERNLIGVPLRRDNFEHTDLIGADLAKTSLYRADLSLALLGEANLSRANLVQTNLQSANLVRGNLSEAVLWGANLSYAIIKQTNLSGACLRNANLSEAWIVNSDLSRADLRGADLSGVILHETDLSGADLSNVLFTTDEVFNRLINWWIPKLLYYVPLLCRSKWIKGWKAVGVTDFNYVDTSKINASCNPILKRHMEDFQFIHGFKYKSWFHRWVFYPLWKITSDCGRSLLLWLIWSVVIAGFFAIVYTRHLDWFVNAKDWFNAVYFSVVTFTTLGFGDLTPRLTSRTAQTWVMAEVIIGYIMLGGLISILANKLARRA